MRAIKAINDVGVKFVKIIKIMDNGNKIGRFVCPNCGHEFEMWLSHFYRNSNACKCRIHHKRLYEIYTNMKSRCYNQNVDGYRYYGARGIKICDEWLNDYKKFEIWALSNGYSDDLTIDRIDVDSDYSPNNCRWATIEEQAQNKRNTILVDGMSLRKYCRLHNLSYKQITSKLYRNKYLELSDED